MTWELSHWTLDTIKLAYVGNEHLFQMRPRTVNITGRLTRRLCQPSVSRALIATEDENCRAFLQCFASLRKHKLGRKY